MLNSYYTEKLLGLQEVSIKKVNDTKENYEIFIGQPRKQCVCPACGKVTDKVHDYRMQRIKELSAFEKPVVLVLRKRRYAWLLWETLRRAEQLSSEIPAHDPTNHPCPDQPAAGLPFLFLGRPRVSAVRPHRHPLFPQCPV